jgi:Sec-independent protein translocase protein TatA
LAFVQRVAQAGIGRPGVESVCALIASRPPVNWTDLDVTRFPEAARAIGTALREAATATRDKGLLNETMKGLDRSDRKRAEELLKNLRAFLCRNAKQESHRVIKVALAELASEIDREESRTDTNNG